MNDNERTTDLTVSGPDERDAVAAGLTAILAAARPAGHRPDADLGAEATAIRGQGADLPALFFELANDLLARLDDAGGAVAAVRLDGLLRTEDGYTAWGYALGDSVAAGPPIALTLAAVPTVERGDDSIILRIRLRHG